MTTWRSLGCLCCLLALTACEGGSGSSGFDVRSENAAIQQALDTQQCVQHESLAICPAASAGKTPSPTPPPSAHAATTTVSPARNTPTASPAAVSPTGTPGGSDSTPGASTTPTPSAVPITSAVATATGVPTRTVPPVATATAGRTATATASASATPFSGPQQIDIGIDPTAPVTCAAMESSGGCDLVLPFMALGFPPTASFRVAVRTVNPNGDWVIGPALAAPDVSAPSFDAPIALGAPVAATGTEVQVAVLVFSDVAAAVPGSVEELADSGAEAAFVSEPFTVREAG